MKSAAQPAAIGALTVIGLGLAFTLFTVWHGLDYGSTTSCLEILIASIVAAYAGAAGIVLCTSGNRSKAGS